MGKASITDIDNLSDMVGGIGGLMDSWDQAARNLGQSIKEEHNELLDRLRVFTMAMEDSLDALLEATRAVEVTERVLDDARAELASCQASDNEHQDCGSEASAVDAAKDDLQKAQEELDEARERHRLTCALHEEAEAVVHLSGQDLVSMADTIAAAGPAITPFADAATGRLRAAHDEALAYATGGPRGVQGSNDGHAGSLSVGAAASAAASSWLDWRPSLDRPITPDVLANRLNIDLSTGEALAARFVQDDSTFNRHVERLRTQYAEAKGPLDVQRVQQGIRRDLVGRYAELLVERACAPLCTRVDTQRTESLEGGRCTRIDLVLEGLRTPMILGRGERLGAPAGANLAIEVKAGRSDYLAQEAEHMEFQAKGHHEVAQASAILCTRNIKDLDPDEEKSLRERMRAAGSPIIGMLPRKEELDQICTNLIHRQTGGRPW